MKAIIPCGPPRVLLTGALGLIGRPMIARLAAHGFTVHGTSRSADGHGQPQGLAQLHAVDLLDHQAIEDLVARVQPTHLIHLAWVTTHQAYWTSLENLRWVEASLRLIDAFHRIGGKRLVIAGTCAEHVAPATLYGSAKHALHVVAEAYARQAGLGAAWARLFFVYGPGEQEERLIPSVVRSLLAGRRVACTSGEERRDFLFVDDAASALVALLESDVTGAVNVGSGSAFAVRDVIHGIADRLDARRLVDFGALERRAGEPELVVADVSRLQSEVGWRPEFTLQRGLDETIAWWRARSQGDA